MEAIDDSKCTPRRSMRNRRVTPKTKVFEENSMERSLMLAREYNEKILSDSSQTDNESVEDDKSHASTTPIQDAVSTNCPLAGKEIYGFQKIKKHEKIISTPRKHEMEQMPSVKVPKTPHKVRKRLQQGIKKTLEDVSSDDDIGRDYFGSDSSATLSESSDSEEEERIHGKSETHDNTPAKLRKTPKTQCESKPKVTTGAPSCIDSGKQRKYVIKTEEYFAHSGSKSVTSNHTLDKLKTPRLSQDQVQKLLSQMSINESHEISILALTEQSRRHFSQWMCVMHENFNILLYGLGSKKNLLNAFHEEMLSDSPVVVVNGFFPSLSLKDILDAVANDLLQLNANTANAFETIDLIEREFNCFEKHVNMYMIIHNIEGDMLRNNKSQSVLSRLAAIPNVHLIASIDHINAPLVWDHNKLSKFNFIWFDVTSFLPYLDETSFESSMMVQKTGNLALSSLRNVFLSLTSNSKGIYTIIIKYQLEHNTNQYYQGLLFKDLYASCREAFLVSSDLALRAQLTEFVDHKMVKLKRSVDGAENLVIPIANNLLQQFLNEQTN